MTKEIESMVDLGPGNSIAYSRAIVDDSNVIFLHVDMVRDLYLCGWGCASV